jgi:hypothetical protein
MSRYLIGSWRLKKEYEHMLQDFVAHTQKAIEDFPLKEGSKAILEVWPSTRLVLLICETQKN